MKLHTFSIGGVHPDGNKLSSASAIQMAPLPKQAVILLSQHIGAPTQCVVGRGQVVRVGQLLGQSQGFVSANIHSSVSGKVAKIADAVDASGYARPAVYIDVEGDEWDESIDRSETIVREITMDAPQIISRIASHGIVGLGGACFPTHVKLSPPKDNVCDCVIINGAECEPYLTADHRLMVEKPEQILVGIRILMKAMNAPKAFIGIEDNKKDAIEAFLGYKKDYPEISVVPLKARYPQGGEKQLIQAITNRYVASGALPISTGALVQNVATAFAVYEAVQKNKPLVERVVTVTGKSLASPKNFLCRIGTEISTLIDACGGLPLDTGKIISGGVMMGKALVGGQVPTSKGTSGITILRMADAKRKKEQPCIRCAKCVSACPMGLEPYLLSQLSRMGLYERMEKESAMDCIACGACQFTCPANRPLLDYITLGKNRLGAIIRARKQSK